MEIAIWENHLRAVSQDVSGCLLKGLDPIKAHGIRQAGTGFLPFAFCKPPRSSDRHGEHRRLYREEGAAHSRTQSSEAPMFTQRKDQNEPQLETGKVNELCEETARESTEIKESERAIRASWGETAWVEGDLVDGLLETELSGSQEPTHSALCQFSKASLSLGAPLTSSLQKLEQLRGLNQSPQAPHYSWKKNNRIFWCQQQMILLVKTRSWDSLLLTICFILMNLSLPPTDEQKLN